MHPRIRAEIVALARATPGVEVCGYIVRDPNGEPRLMPCANIAPPPTPEDPSPSFLISDEDQMRALSLGQANLLGFYHSHPNLPGFSAGNDDCDVERAHHMALPWHLYCVAADSWAEYIPPTYDLPLEGRLWTFGFHDCYECVRAHFRRKGHYMGDYDRDETLNLRDLILARFEAEGFRQVAKDDIRLDDVLMFESDRLLSNHFGVLVGPSKMLHHQINCLSRVEPVTGRWLSRLVAVFRRQSG